MLEARVISCLVLAAVLQTLTTILLDSGGALGMSEAELALLNIDVFTVPWCMKIKPTMLWLSGTKQELSPWFQSLWFPSWSNFCLFFFSNSLKCDQLWEWLHFWTWASEVAACVNLALLISWERILLPCSPWLPNIIFSKKLKAEWPCHAGLSMAHRTEQEEEITWGETWACLSGGRWRVAAPTHKAAGSQLLGTHSNKIFPGMLSYLISGCV